MPSVDAEKVVLLEVGGDTWQESLRRVRPWLTATATLQSTFRRLSFGVAGRVDEPHIRTYLGEVAEVAGRHEALVDEVCSAFGVPSVPRPAVNGAAAVASSGRYAAGQLVGRLSGAHGPGWRGLRVLLRSNLDAISGFAVTEQLGLALGNPRVVDLVFPVLKEKKEHQLLLQEYLLEMASNAVLRRRDA